MIFISFICVCLSTSSSNENCFILVPCLFFVAISIFLFHCCFNSCQLFRMGLRDKTTPTLNTPLIWANMSCVVATIFSSLAFLSSSISMANLSRLVAASFSSLPLLSSFVSTTNLSSLPVTTFSSLRLLSNSLSSPRFNLLRVVRNCFLWFSVFLFSRLILSLSFLCLQSLKLCLL